MREIATGEGAAISRDARKAMEATPAGREALRRIERGEHLAAGHEIVTTPGGKGFDIRRKTTAAPRAGKIQTPEQIKAAKQRLTLMLAENEG